MEEHTTYPSILAVETIPVPLSAQSLPGDVASRSNASGGVRFAVKLLLLALAVWCIKHWW